MFDLKSYIEIEQYNINDKNITIPININTEKIIDDAF